MDRAATRKEATPGGTREDSPVGTDSLGQRVARTVGRSKRYNPMPVLRPIVRVRSTGGESCYLLSAEADTDTCPNQVKPTATSCADKCRCYPKILIY